MESPKRHCRVYCDSRSVSVDLPPHRAFAPIFRIGGRTGWYYGNWLWQIRGGIDRLFGGPGMQRGRPAGEQLAVGDTLDCWRVAAFEPDRRLQLVLEMKAPGRGMLEFEVFPQGSRTIIRQTATFEARGFLGVAYWYLSSPAHAFIFSGMLQGIASRALANGSRRTPPAEQREFA